MRGTHSGVLVPDPSEFAPADPARLAEIQTFLDGDDDRYLGFLGVEVEEVRAGYCRARLPFKPQLLQARGVVTGGVYASLLDFAPVPALAASLSEPRPMPTIDLHVQFHGAVTDEDLVAVGWVIDVRRTVAFARSVVLAGDDRLIASGAATFQMGRPTTGDGTASA